MMGPWYARQRNGLAEGLVSWMRSCPLDQRGINKGRMRVFPACETPDGLAPERYCAGYAADASDPAIASGGARAAIREQVLPSLESDTFCDWFTPAHH